MDAPQRFRVRGECRASVEVDPEHGGAPVAVSRSAVVVVDTVLQSAVDAQWLAECTRGFKIHSPPWGHLVAHNHQVVTLCVECSTTDDPSSKTQETWQRVEVRARVCDDLRCGNVRAHVRICPPPSVAFCPSDAVEADYYEPNIDERWLRAS